MLKEGAKDRARKLFALCYCRVPRWFGESAGPGKASGTRCGDAWCNLTREHDQFAFGIIPFCIAWPIVSPPAAPQRASHGRPSSANATLAARGRS